MNILIVDDNKNITSSLEKYLNLKKHEVTVCNEGSEGLKLIQNEKWDKVLLDLSMPDVSGLDIIEALEKNNTLKDKNILLFTASSIPEYVLNKLLSKEGVQGCLKKPLSLASLTETLVA